MDQIVIIIRCPDLTIGPLDAYRFVYQRGKQLIASRLVQGDEVDRRLDQGTNRPYRVERPVKSCIAGISIPHQSGHFTGLHVSQSHRPL